MSAYDVLRLATQASYVVVALLTLGDLIRYRDRPRWDIFLLFGGFAALVLVQWLHDTFAPDLLWLDKILYVILLAHPYLLLRVVRHLRPVPRQIRWFTWAGFLTTSIIAVVFPEPLPIFAVLIIVVYILVGDGYAAYEMIQGARQASGVSHRRLLLAAIGFGLIALVILLAGIRNVIPPTDQDPLRQLGQLISLLAIVSFFLAFAPPTGLRRIWQLNEIHRFLHQSSEARIAQNVEETLNALCSVAQRSVGGSAAVATLWDSEENQHKVAAATRPEYQSEKLNLDHPEIHRAWDKQLPVVLEMQEEGIQSGSQPSQNENPRSVFVVPIANQERAWGLLLVYLPWLPLFPLDDLSMLSLISDQTATSLSYTYMLADQGRLIEKLRRSTERLEAMKVIDHAILAAQLPDKIAHVALTHLERVVPFERASVVLFDAHTQEVHSLAVLDCTETSNEDVTALPAEVFTYLQGFEGSIFVLDDVSMVQAPFNLGSALLSWGVRSIMLVPLKVEDHLIGTLKLASRQPHTFQAEHQEIAREISGQLAITLQQAGLRQELERTNAVLEQRVLERTHELELAVQNMQTEVVARQQAGEALRRAQDRLQFLLSATPAIIYSANSIRKQPLNFVSENVLEQLGYEARSFVAEPGFWAERLHPDDAPRVLSQLETLSSYGSHAMEYRFQHANGHYIWVRDEFRVICDDMGYPVEVVGYWIDISLRRNAEESVRRLNEDLSRRALDLQAANKELEAFAYSVSHDLRSPLRAIDGFSRVLLDNYAADLPPDAQRYLQLVRNNTRDMGQLIDDLLSFSRVNKQSLKVADIEPKGLARVVLRDLLAENNGRAIDVIVGDLPECKGDYNLLKQVFTNLLSNAIKFTRTREEARIEIGGKIEDGEARYYVRDNGVGFDMKYANKLFGVFQRLHRPEDFEGTGVGLAIVQRIILRHGGRIWAEAEPDRGATFYFTLPVN